MKQILILILLAVGALLAACAETRQISDDERYYRNGASMNAKGFYGNLDRWSGGSAQ
jgi:hypothetical protein